MLPKPTLLGMDPIAREVYVRSKGLTDRCGNIYADAGFTALDARSGRVLHVWHDVGGNPSIPIGFVRTSNGLRAYTTVIPALARAVARVDTGQSTDLVDEMYDAQSGWAAFVTASGPAAVATAELWVFDLKSGRLRTFALPRTAQYVYQPRARWRCPLPRGNSGCSACAARPPRRPPPRPARTR